jgi:preprotein translocase subunit Sec61beta
MAESMSMPGVFGGLMRYNEEYKSKFMFKPLHVIIAIIVFALLVVVARIYF